jgi:hypothetical protein
MFWNLWTLYFFSFPNFFSGHGIPRVTESADTGVCLYIFLRISSGKYLYCFMHKDDPLYLSENGCKKFILKSRKYTVFVAGCEVQTVSLNSWQMIF